MSKRLFRRPRLSTLHNLLEKCWYNGDGRYATIGKWEIGLGGYDLGYEISYNNTPIFAIDNNNYIDFYGHTKETLGYTDEEVFNILKEYRDLYNLKNRTEYNEE